MSRSGHRGIAGLVLFFLAAAALMVVVAQVPSVSGGAGLVRAGEIGFAYDGASGLRHRDGRAGLDEGALGPGPTSLVTATRSYDSILNLALAPAAARLMAVERRVADVTRSSLAFSGELHAPEAVGAAVRPHRHHTVPSEILRQIPDDIANHPLVRGRAGAPNRWAIPEDVHRAIHSGPGGGAYNQAWKDALDSLGRSPTVDDMLRLRGQITKQFGIDIYSPYS